MKKVLLTLAFAGCALMAADGKAIYDASCKSCHGADGKTERSRTAAGDSEIRCRTVPLPEGSVSRAVAGDAGGGCPDRIRGRRTGGLGHATAGCFRA